MQDVTVRLGGEVILSGVTLDVQRARGRERVEWCQCSAVVSIIVSLVIIFVVAIGSPGGRARRQPADLRRKRRPGLAVV